MATTLRSGISDTVNVLNKFLLKTLDPAEESRLRKLRRIYFALWEEVIKQEIDNRSSDFKDALEALSIAEKYLEKAKSDIAEIADAINKAVIAAKAVDKIVKLGIDLLA
jgi:hypothetical protein